MANQAEYVASIGLDLANLEKGIGEARQKLAKMGNGVPTTGIDSFLSAAAAKFKKFGADLEKVGTSLSIGLTAPLVLMGKKIIDIGFDYEKSMNTFSAVTHATAEEMKRASAVAVKLGNDAMLPAVSAATAATSMSELGKSGLNAAQSMDAARGVLLLSTAAQIDAGKAAEIAGNALNTFGLAASDAGRVADLLAAASNASSAEITDIAMSLQQAGSSAAALKIPIQDLVTSIGEMANAGIKGSDAGTSLKTFMAALAPHTKDAAAAMKQLGIDAFDSQGKFVGLSAVIQQAAPALARMTDEQKTHAIQAAFGSDAMRAANIILGQGVEKFNEMSGAVGQSGAAAELAAAKTKGLSGAWDGFVSQLETVGLQAFKSVQGALEGFVRQAASAVEGIGQLDSSAIKMGVSFAAVAASAGPIALMIGQLIKLGPQGAAVAGVIAGAGLMAGAYTTNFGQMTSVLDRFFATLMNKSKEGEGVTGSFGTALSKLGVYVVAGIELATTTIEKFITNLRTAADLAGAIATGQFNKLGEIWSQGQANINAISEASTRNAINRNRELEALDRGGAAAHFKLLSTIAGNGSKSVADAFYTGYSQNDPIIKLKSNTQKEVESFMGSLKASFTRGGSAAGQALYDAAYGQTHHSPFFIIHWLQEAADYANNEAPTQFGKAGTKMAEKLKAGFTAALGSINDLLGRFGSGGDLSDSAFDSMLRKFPQVTDELYKQSIALKEVNRAMEIYATASQTAAGRDDERTQKVKAAFGALLQTDRILREVITPTYANLGEVIKSKLVPELANLGGAIEEVKFVVDEFGNLTTEKAYKALQKLADEGFARLGDQAAELAHKLPDSWNTIIDAIVNGSGKVGSAVYEMAIKIKGWAGDIIGVVDTLPGKFGDAARKVVDTVDQWVKFADKVLAVLNRMNSSIPGSIGGMVEKVLGSFKKTTQATEVWSEDIWAELQNMSKNTAVVFDDWGNVIQDKTVQAMSKAQGAAKSGMGNFLNTIKGGLGFAGSLFGSFMTGLGVSNSTGSKTKGAIMGGISGALSGAATGAMWGAAGGPIGALGGALIGGAVGIIGGLFGGGKSKEQKAAEEAAKQKAGLDMQKLAADIMSSQMEGLKKGLELLEGLKTFSEVPRKAITRFFNEIEQILTLFGEMAKKFKAESIEASKSVAEVMQGAFESMLSGANLIHAIKESETLTDQNISIFIETVFKIFSKWEEATNKIEVSTAKFTGKIADKLRTSFEFLSIIPDLLKGITENKGFDDSLIDPMFDSVTKIVTKMKALSEAERGMELNRTGATATILGTIFETTKAIVEALGLFAGYKPLGDSAFSSINGDIVKVTNWMDGLVVTTASWGSLADAALSNVNKWADSLGKTASAIKAAIGGASSTSGITSNIQYGGGAAFARREGAASTTPANTTYELNITLQVSGSVITEGELLRKAREEFRKELKELGGNLRLSSIS